MDLFGKVYVGIEKVPIEAVLVGVVARRVECPVCNLIITLPDAKYHHWQCKACHVTVEAKSLEKT